MRPRPTKRPPPAPDAGSPPPERRRHDALLAEIRVDRDATGRELSRTVGVRVVSQTPLDRYLGQGHISAEQWWGGDQLRADFEKGSFETIAQSRWDGQPGGGPADLDGVSLAACAARRAYLQAVRSTPARLSPVLVHVCCLRGYAADWALAKGLPRGDGMALLRLGLDLLADHYRAGAAPQRIKPSRPGSKTAAASAPPG